MRGWKERPPLRLSVWKGYHIKLPLVGNAHMKSVRSPWECSSALWLMMEILHNLLYQHSRSQGSIACIEEVMHIFTINRVAALGSTWMIS